MGLRNALINNFDAVNERFDIEDLLKQYSASYFSCHPQWNCHYWQTKQGQSLDFLLINDFDTLPVEIKISSNKGSYVQRYQKKNNLDQACIITLNRFSVSPELLTLPVWLL